ncbi:retropepsin-like aspartic protease [Swingsia samuiensis]|nr:retropepsin-like aspartic protease [Swingsia samuiensis]
MGSLPKEGYAEEKRILVFDPELVNQDRSGPPYIAVRDSKGILEAMERGDDTALLILRDRLAQDYRKDADYASQFMLSLCDASLARLHGNYARSNQILMQARQDLGPLKNTINPFIYIIDQMRSGNLFLQGKIKDWANMQEWLAQEYYVPLRQHYHISNLEFRNDDVITLTVPASQIPQDEVIEASENRIPFNGYTAALDDHGLIEAKGPITINGEVVSAVLDTGTFASSLPRSYVEKHPSLKVVGVSHDISSGNRRRHTEYYVLIDTLKLGGTTFHNQMFSISKDEEIMIGLQQLSQLRHVTIGRKGATFGINAPFSCKNELVMSSFRGGYSAKWLLPVELNRDSVMAIVNTGDDSPEVVIKKVGELPSSIHARSVEEYGYNNDGFYTESVASKRMNIKLGDVSIEDYLKYREEPSDLPAMLSTAALRYGSYSFDWPTQKACFQ